MLLFVVNVCLSASLRPCTPACLPSCLLACLLSCPFVCLRDKHDVHCTMCVTACHELRNPLHAVLATLEFLLEDSSNMTAAQIEDINSILLSASHMQRLVNDVLDLAKIREGSLQIRPEPVRMLCRFLLR